LGFLFYLDFLLVCLWLRTIFFVVQEGVVEVPTRPTDVTLLFCILLELEWNSSIFLNFLNYFEPLRFHWFFSAEFLQAGTPTKNFSEGCLDLNHLTSSRLHCFICSFSQLPLLTVSFCVHPTVIYTIT
jgi:hypothetical protein